MRGRAAKILGRLCLLRSEEDQDGVRGTLPAEQFKTPGPAAKDAEGAEGAEGAAEGGAEGKDGPGTPPASEPTSTPGITVEWGKAHQRNAAGDVEGKAKRAAGPRRKAKTKPIIDEVTMLTNEQIKAQLADTSDIVKPRGPDVVYKMADPAYDVAIVDRDLFGRLHVFLQDFEGFCSFSLGVCCGCSSLLLLLLHFLFGSGNLVGVP